MQLITYKTAVSGPRLGILHHDQVLDAETFGELVSFPVPHTMLGLIDRGLDVAMQLHYLLINADADDLADCVIPNAEMEILAPIPKPRKNIFGIGLNFTEHVAESARTLDTSKELPQQPVIFSKPPTAVIGQNGEIKHNQKITQQLDHEGKKFEFKRQK